MCKFIAPYQYRSAYDAPTFPSFVAKTYKTLLKQVLMHFQLIAVL